MQSGTICVVLARYAGTSDLSRLQSESATLIAENVLLYNRKVHLNHKSFIENGTLVL